LTWQLTVGNSNCPIAFILQRRDWRLEVSGIGLKQRDRLVGKKTNKVHNSYIYGPQCTAITIRWYPEVACGTGRYLSKLYAVTTLVLILGGYHVAIVIVTRETRYSKRVEDKWENVRTFFSKNVHPAKAQLS